MFPEEERRIFSYWAGPMTGPLHADPYTILRRLTVELGGDVNLTLEEWYSENVVLAAMAEERLIDATRKSFKMDVFDETKPNGGGGAMDADVLDTLRKFLEFLDQKKSNTSNSQTPPTGSLESLQPTGG